ncbi:MAG: MBL fold metallo-hydrolase [Halanaerobiales bacterium]
MKFKWWGQASFLITKDDGTKIVTDPYNEDLPYKKINDEADYVTVSHDHFDHNAVDTIPGQPYVVNNVSGFKDKEVDIIGISTYHDDSEGVERGENIIFMMQLDGMKVSHLGDLGHSLDSSQIEKLKDTDILLLPVGGHFTIDADQAYQIVKELDPKVVVPMHFKTDILDLPIKGVDKFLDNFSSEKIEKVNNCELEINKLPDTQTVYVLDYVQ